jgi:putative colanic acid biosynthesis UDP-glucose lipid carrier transferase
MSVPQLKALPQSKVSDHHKRATAGDPSVVFAINYLLCPVTVLLALTISLMVWRIPFTGPYMLVAALALVGVTDFLRLPTIRGRQSIFTASRFLLDTALRWALVFGIIFALIYFSGVAERLNANVLLTWVISTTFLLWGGQLAGLHWGLRRVPPRRAVIVGLTDLGVRLQHTLTDDPLMCTDVIGFFEDRGPDRLSPELRKNVLGRAVHLPEFIMQNKVDVVYITLPMTRHPRVLHLMEQLRDSTVSIYFVPDLFIFNLVQARLDFVHGVPVVAVRESPFYGVHGISKRLCDLLIALTLVILLFPILVSIAMSVRVTSPGPVLFKQRRYGLDGKPIIVYKFRSMTVTEDGENSYTQVTRNDSRVTRLGAILRKTSLDELPQLFNVIKGSMSIVGPRPHAVAVNEQYRQLIPSYMVRHKVKPGITGLAQVNGYRGGDDLESMTKRVNLDLIYLSQWSMRMDMLILLKTALIVWKDRRAY